MMAQLLSDVEEKRATFVIDYLIFLVSDMRTLLFLLLSTCSGLVSAQKIISTGEWCSHRLTPGALPPSSDGRADSVDLTHARISLDMTAAATQTISGSCTWTFTAKTAGLDQLRFDLLALTVDSVIYEQTPVAFSQFGEQVYISLPAALGTGDTRQVSIYYHGQPQKDASGWGGFYFSGSYAFNLGVGFDADPHTFGRAWFPCFDLFEERSTYTFDVVSNPDQPSYCNGLLQSEETTPGGKLRRIWSLTETIPSYLACVAIGPYTTFRRAYAGVNGTIPVEIAAAAADTTKVRNTFVHLPEAIQAYEHWYGPYLWQKIGYSLVPFNSGAMEHATNVAIGRTFINGSLSYETLWAHELSHHWWGDLATCSTAEDMWLNEGWASYSEHLFTEWTYGKKAYNDAVRANFLNVLQNSHISEGGYRAVSGVPHNLTYGSHVYNKGAVVAHNLRAYMGDSLFRVGIRAALESTRYDDWSSENFRDQLEAATGLELHPFFNDWVFNGGYPDYSIDSVQWTYPIPGKVHARIHVKQKLRGAPTLHTQVPLELTAVSVTGEKKYLNTVVTGEQTVVDWAIDLSEIVPVDIWVNTGLRLLQARSEEEKMITVNGATNFQEAKFNLTVTNPGADSVLFRVEHHFAVPDDAGANPAGHTLTNRYWQVYGQFTPEFAAQATVFYDGRGQGDQLDTELFAATGSAEDQVALLYRTGAGQPWQVYPHYTRQNIGTNTDKFGQFKLSAVKAGQYTVAKLSGVNRTNEADSEVTLQIFPNPATDRVTVVSDIPVRKIRITGTDGKIVREIDGMQEYRVIIGFTDLPAGMYRLVAESDGLIRTGFVQKL